jgi:pimeloyl-ACP methyl ester carboxylesterase
MTVDAPAVRREDHMVNANGIDIHVVEAGTGPPLLLLDNAMVSSNPVWSGHPVAYITHLDAFAAHFRVIIPDTRGSGRTAHPGGPITHALLADDVLGLIGALDLDRPMVCGFSDGGEVATFVGIRGGASVRAIVNHGGYDQFNPDPSAPSLMMTRQMLGGDPQATSADFEAIDRLGQQVPEMAAMWDRMRADHDAAQGAGHWRTVVSRTFERISQPHGRTVEDLRAIAAPTLILVGDRDVFCTVEDGAACFRALPAGEMAVMPGTGHEIDAASVDMTISFLRRHASI